MEITMKKATLLTTFKVSALALSVAGITACGSSSSNTASPATGQPPVSQQPVENQNAVEENTDLNTGGYLNADGEEVTIDDLREFVHPDLRLIREDGVNQPLKSGVSGIDLSEDLEFLDLTIINDGGSPQVVRLNKFIDEDDGEEFYTNENFTWSLTLLGDGFTDDTGFSFMELGEWQFSSASLAEGNDYTNITIGMFATGLETSEAEINSLIDQDQVISYDQGFYLGVSFDGEGNKFDKTGSASMTANFDTLRVNLTLLENDNSTFLQFNDVVIEGNTFSKDGSESVSGRFFGPNAAEAGGTWSGNDYIGVFGVKQ